MGRPLRQTAGGVVYHVLNRRVLRLPLFTGEGDYLAFVRVLGEALDRPGSPAVFAFCLMPNHWHLLLRPGRAGGLSQWMQWLTVTHTHRWHMNHRTVGTGPVYQGRFRSFPVQSDSHFLTVARYIERNPLRARLCARAQLYRWSSLGLLSRSRLTEEEVTLRQRLADWPVDRPRRWAEQVNQPHTEAELTALRHCVQRGSPYGSEPWTRNTAAKLALTSTLRPRGRPRIEPDRSSEMKSNKSS